MEQVFADHCAKTKEDGKLISRHLLLSGNFENYTNTRKVAVQPQVNINGQIYQLNLEVDVPNNNNTIFVVDSMKFLDKNPETSTTQTGTTVTTASVTPVGPAPVAPQTPVQNVVAQAPVQQTVVQTPVQTVDMSQAMNPPVVDPGFVQTGETAPF